MLVWQNLYWRRLAELQTTTGLFVYITCRFTTKKSIANIKIVGGNIRDLVGRDVTELKAAAGKWKSNVSEGYGCRCNPSVTCLVKPDVPQSAASHMVYIWKANMYPSESNYIQY